jgi:hypothetical protein
MAQIFEHLHAQSVRIVQTRTRGRLPNSIVSLKRIRLDRSFAAYQAETLQEEIVKALQAVAEWERIGASLRLKAESLKQQARSAKP